MKKILAPSLSLALTFLSAFVPLANADVTQAKDDMAKTAAQLSETKTDQVVPFPGKLGELLTGTDRSKAYWKQFGDKSKPQNPTTGSGTDVKKPAVDKTDKPSFVSKVGAFVGKHPVLSGIAIGGFLGMLGGPLGMLAGAAIGAGAGYLYSRYAKKKADADAAVG